MEPSKTQENNQQAESPMDVDKNQQDNNKDIVDTDAMLNQYVPTEGSADIEQEKEKEEDTAVLEQKKADQKTPDSVKKVDEDNANVE